MTIGAYDGVHLGHRYLLDKVIERATSEGLESVVVTFDRHPATVVRPESAPLLLTDLEQRLELLAACGIDRTLVVPFDTRRADESAEEFVSDVLVKALRTRWVVVGRDFHFGHGRKGNVELLRELGRTMGFEVDGVDLRETDDGPVSSTRIRSLIGAGDVRRAAGFLGRPHELRGSVGHGDGRGAALSMPTANIDVPAGLVVPAPGVYAGWYRRSDGQRHRAAISIGPRATFYNDPAPTVVEAHLLDFTGDLYGEEASVSFVDWIRSQERFTSADQLVAQMRADVDRADELLAAS